MEPITRKKIGRSALRNHCKKIEKDIETLLTNFDSNDLMKLKSLKANYLSQIEKVGKANVEVQALIAEEAALTSDIENAMLESDIHFDLLAKIESCLEKEDTKPADAKTSVKTSVADSSDQVLCTKVSKLEPPTFDGDILNWNILIQGYHGLLVLYRELSY